MSSLTTLSYVARFTSRLQRLGLPYSYDLDRTLIVVHSPRVVKKLIQVQFPDIVGEKGLEESIERVEVAWALDKLLQ